MVKPSSKKATGSAKDARVSQGVARSHVLSRFGSSVLFPFRGPTTDTSSGLMPASKSSEESTVCTVFVS